MFAVPVEKLRHEAEEVIAQAVEYLIQEFPAYQPATIERGTSWTRSISVSPGTTVKFTWEVRDKHYIVVAPRLRPSDPSDQGDRVHHNLGFPSNYGIERLVKYGGGSDWYLLYRSNPVLGVQELVRRVPELLGGDWNRRAEIERVVADGPGSARRP